MFKNHGIQMDNVGNKLMRSSSMSPSNNRLSRSHSDIPAYLMNQKMGMCNVFEPIIYYSKKMPDFQLINPKFSPNNNINKPELSVDVDENCKKYQFEKENTNDVNHFMKSPSMGSIHMDYKEKTAEFEREDLSQNHASD